MADATARFLLTAEDRTAAAFASADRSIRTIARNALQFRSILAGFGVIVTGRMFANWVKDAIEVQKLTAEQAQTIGEAKKAVNDLNTAFQDIARTAVTELAPSLERAAKFWKEFFFPSGSQFGASADALREQVDAQIAEVERLQRLLGTQETYNAEMNAFQRFVFGELDTSETTRQLAAAREELERLRSAWQTAMGGPPAAPNLLAGFHRIGDFADRNKGAKRPQIAIDYLDEFEEIVVEARKISEDEILKPFPAAEVRQLFEPIKKEGRFTAEFIGEQFRDSFTDWIRGAEHSFRDLLKRMAAEMATSALFTGLASLFPGGSFFANFFGGSRASGGSTRGGMVYKVHPGEAFFTPGQDGHVGAVGGGGDVNIYQTNHFSGGDSREQAAAIAANNARLKLEVMAEMRERDRRRR